MAQEIFERCEKKYLLPKEVYFKILPELIRHMEADAYGKYTISNIYFDTDDFELIRTSLEKPVYKEKLRLRCYGTPGEDSTVYAEIKKKFCGVVYKRRVPLKLSEARRALYYGIRPDTDGWSFTEKQILKEISYMKERKNLKPAVFIAYDRIAFAGKEDKELRVTFDNNIRCRTRDLDLASGKRGEQLLEPDTILMEVKIPGAMPLWMAELFRDIAGYQCSFSKYGAYYRKLLMKDRMREAENTETKAAGNAAGRQGRKEGSRHAA